MGTLGGNDQFTTMGQVTDILYIVNGAYYRDVLLSQHLLPAIRAMSGEFFIFQQDSAPAHRACETVEMLRQNAPAFIPPTLWPPNSSDLNPVDYKIWESSTSVTTRPEFVM